MEYLSLSNSQNNNDYTNEDDFGSEIDHYSKDVSVFKTLDWMPKNATLIRLLLDVISFYYFYY